MRGFQLILATLVTVVSAQAQEENPVTPETIAMFIHTFVANDIADYSIPGAAVVVARKNGIIFAKGYGVADIESNRPFDPFETVVRAGSVSKCFTAAAIVRLAHEGKLAMDAPINDYVKDVAIPQPFGPIRVSNLLTHTAGFDDTIVDMHERDVEDWVPLAPYLEAELPAPAMPPGLCTSYSSWDFAIAGLVIEGASGMPYDEYIRQSILEPLGMMRSSFRLPDPPADLMADLASGYNVTPSGHKQYPFDYIKASPGIALLTTPENIGHFIVAQLNEGRWQDEAALLPPIIEAMQTTQFANHEKIRGFTYGFAEWRENGRRMLFHDGNAIGHTGRLVIIPEHDIGFYLVYNIVPFGPGGAPSEAGRLNRRFTTAFLDEFYPDVSPPRVKPTGLVEALPPIASFAGHYRPTNYSRHTFQKLASLMEQVPVRVVQEDTIIAGSSKYVRVAPELFQYEEGGDSYVPFRIDETDAPTHLFFGTGSYEKVRWAESSPVQTAVFVTFFLTFVLTLPLITARWYLARKHNEVLTLSDKALFIAATTNILFLVGLAGVMLRMDTMELFAGVPPILALILHLPLISGSFGVLAGVALLRGSGSGRLTRAHQALTTLAVLTFVPFLWYWNLIGI